MEHKKLIPNSTQIPNVLIDQLFPFLSESELRVVLYIARRTYGFQKEKDGIGLGQFTDGIVKGDGTILDHGAGVKRTTAIRTLKILDKAGLITVKRAKMGEKGRKENIYSLNLDVDLELLIPLLEEIRGASKWTVKPNLFNMTSATKRPSAPSGTTPSATSGPSTSATERTHKTKGNKVTKQSIYAPGAHTRIIRFFHDTCLATRGIKPGFGVEDGKRLKDVLALEIIPEPEFERIIIYYLGSYHFKTFSPSMKTMLSAGILNGIQNKIKNDPKFWKELDEVMDRVYPRVRPARVKVDPNEEEDYRQPVKGPTALGDLMKDMMSKLGLIAVNSG